MPRGRPRTRSDSITDRPRVVMDIRPKAAAVKSEEPITNHSIIFDDYPMPVTMQKAPIFANVLLRTGGGIKVIPSPLRLGEFNEDDSTEEEVSSESSILAPLSVTATPPPIIMTQILSSTPDSTLATIPHQPTRHHQHQHHQHQHNQQPEITQSPKHKPFICFYCGFQCDSHLMRHRCVPKKAKKRRIAPAPNSHLPDDLENSPNMESEAAEILTEMLTGGVS